MCASDVENTGRFSKADMRDRIKNDCKSFLAQRAQRIGAQFLIERSVVGIDANVEG